MSASDAAKATPIVRQQSQTEFEMQAGRRAAERRTAQLAVPVAPKKTIGAVNVIPLSLNATPGAGNEPVDTGIPEAFAALANAPGVVPVAKVPAPNVLGGSTPAKQQTEQQRGPNAAQAKQSGTSPPLQFLGDFFGTDKRHLVAIKKHEKKIEARHFDAADLAGQQKFITNHSDAGFDIYFSPNPIKGTLHKKAKKSDVAEARHLWIDLDPRVNEPLEAERAAMLAQLTTNLPKGIPRPNRIIDSGRGYWGYWKLDKPAPVDGKGPLTDIVESYGKGIEQAFGDRFADGCRNIDRVARLAGTTNRKTGNVARVLHEFSHDEPHPIESFPRSVTNPKDQEAPKGETFKLSGTYEPIDPNDPVLLKLGDTWRAMLAVDDYAADYPSRSEAECAFAVAAIHAGIKDDIIARCVMDGQRKFGAHTREQPNIDRELSRLIEHAHQYAIDPKLAEMNEKHHVVLHGGKTRVLTWENDELYPGRKVPVYQTPQDFRAFQSKYRHSYQKKVPVKDEEGKPTGETEIKTVTAPLGTWWWSNKDRRQYEGLTYAPNTDEDIVGGKLNLWTGFTVAPVKGRGHVGYLKHLRDNICAGNRGHYDYLVRLMARAVQFPERRGEIGVVFIGLKGTGKTFSVEEFGTLFGTHYWTVTNPEHFTGKFNSHLQRCSILLADECLRPENKQHEQIAKTLVTGQTILIEPKGVDAYQVKNFLHVFVCTNSRWAIPATADERRWFILNVGEKHIKDFLYFKKLCDDMAAGGRASLLHYLLNLDISKFEFRDVPETDAMLEQQERTRNGIELMVEGWCRDGIALFSHSERPHVIVTSGSDAKIPWGFDNFIHSKAPEDLRRLGPTRIKRALTKDWGTSHFHSRIAGQIVSGIELPPLRVLRKTFETRCNGGKSIIWPAGNEWVASNDDGVPSSPHAPVQQTTEDVGAPSESDVALDERIKTQASEVGAGHNAVAQAIAQGLTQAQRDLSRVKGEN
jgi:hypothetical protein